MVKISKFDIEFANANGVFYSGQQLSGKVVVELNEAMKLRAIKIRYSGLAFVNFPDANSSTRIHTDTEKYFDAQDIIFGLKSTSIMGADVPTLNAGSHEFAFAFTLPNQLPNSFESKVGHVRYCVKAYLHRPWKFDHTTKKAFTLISAVDLNQEPGAFTPGIQRIEKKFGLIDNLFSCVRGGLSIEIRTNRLAFVPGEAIQIDAEILNNSTERVKSVDAFLVQNVICNAKSGSRFFPGMDRIGTVSKAGLRHGEAQIWNQEKISIPPLPPSKLGGCRLISVDYLLKFVIVVEGHPAVLLFVPITIGSIPLRHSQTLPRAAAASRQPSAPPIEEYLGPPPSYEESSFAANIRDADDNEHMFGQMIYRPRYPIYPTLPAYEESENLTLPPKH